MRRGLILNALALSLMTIFAMVMPAAATYYASSAAPLPDAVRVSWTYEGPEPYVKIVGMRHLDWRVGNDGLRAQINDGASAAWAIPVASHQHYYDLANVTFDQTGVVALVICDSTHVIGYITPGDLAIARRTGFTPQIDLRPGYLTKAAAPMQTYSLGYQYQGPVPAQYFAPPAAFEYEDDFACPDVGLPPEPVYYQLRSAPPVRVAMPRPYKRVHVHHPRRKLRCR